MEAGQDVSVEKLTDGRTHSEPEGEASRLGCFSHVRDVREARHSYTMDRVAKLKEGKMQLGLCCFKSVSLSTVYPLSKRNDVLF